MGGGDLNMKKSWHPVLLVNQEKVWKAEKQVNEEKKKLAQLRKEREEERQLAELQRMQEASTGKKRVDKLDWMYAAPSQEGGALGGARIGDREMEEYLLGKRRVDEVLAQGDKNVGNMHKDFIAVQNANSARDTASKIREDPLLAIKRQELAQIEALKNRPDIRRKLKEMAKAKEAGGESKEERRAKRKAEKEERRRERHERRERRYRDDSRSPRSPRSDDDEREYSRESRRRDSFDRDRARDREDRRYKERTRSVSPKRERERERSRDYRRRDDSPRRYRDESPRRSRDGRDGHRDGDGYRGDRYAERRHDDRNDRDDRDRVPPPRHYSNGNGHGHGHSGRDDVKPEVRSHPSRPSAMDLADRPVSSSASHAHAHTRPPAPASSSAGAGSTPSNSLDDMRAARLAAMSSSATELYEQRTKSLAQRAETERREHEQEEKMRKRYGGEDVRVTMFHQKGDMELGDALQRRAGQGLQRDRGLAT
ncbi:Pre-mRNA-splicing factor cwc25 [Saitozyma sp. JCM 24511]|nr:Pre-mRNA-splicing factor cwc25 [Saitozyma sp. JCM 24511]